MFCLVMVVLGRPWVHSKGIGVDWSRGRRTVVGPLVRGVWTVLRRVSLFGRSLTFIVCVVSTVSPLSCGCIPKEVVSTKTVEYLTVTDTGQIELRGVVDKRRLLYKLIFGIEDGCYITHSVNTESRSRIVTPNMITTPIPSHSWPSPSVPRVDYIWTSSHPLFDKDRDLSTKNEQKKISVVTMEMSSPVDKNLLEMEETEDNEQGLSQELGPMSLHAKEKHMQHSKALMGDPR